MAIYFHGSVEQVNGIWDLRSPSKKQKIKNKGKAFIVV